MYIVPPKLQRRLRIGGFTVPETLIYLGLLLLFIILNSMFFLSLTGVSALLSWRFVGDRNAYFFFKLLFRYYRPSQIFTRRISHGKESAH